MRAIEYSELIAMALKIASRCSREYVGDAAADPLAKLNWRHVARRSGFIAGKVVRVVGVSRVADKFSCEAFVQQTSIAPR